MGAGATRAVPPAPVAMGNIMSWARSIVQYIRGLRVVPGDGISVKQGDGGIVVSALGGYVPGEIVFVHAPLFSASSAQNADYADRGAELRSFYKVNYRLIPADGSTLNTADYPALANILGETGGTFVLPDFRGRFPVGADSRGSPSSHSDTAYVTAGAVGGFRRHGKTENNHHDHNFTIGLNHSHVTATEVASSAGTSVYGTTTSPTELANFDTVVGGESSDAMPDADEGTVGRASSSGSLKDVVSVTLTHRGDDGVVTPGEGNRIDDVDNRPPWMAAHAMIRF